MSVPDTVRKDPLATVCRTLAFRYTVEGPRFSTNDVLHYAHKNQLVRTWRVAGRDQAADAMRGLEARLELAHVFLFWVPGSRRKADPTNAAPAGKALIDGAVLAGMFVDDDSEHLIGPDYRLGRPARLGKGRWRIDVHVWVPDPVVVE